MTDTNQNNRADAVPPIVDQDTWKAALAELRAREKAATRELDAIAAARRRLPIVELPDYTLDGPAGPIRLVDVFQGRRQLIVYNHSGFRARSGSAAAAPASPASSPASTSSTPMTPASSSSPRARSMRHSPTRPGSGTGWSGTRP